MNAPVTRRALLGATTAAVGAVALPAAVLAHGPAKTDPDVALAELVQQHAEALAAWCIAADEVEAAGKRADAAYPPRPEPLYQPAADRLHDLGGAAGRVLGPDGRVRFWYNLDDVDRLRVAGPVTCASYTDDGQPGAPVPDAAGEARRQEILRAADRWMSERDAVDRRVGLAAALEAETPLYDALESAAMAVEAYLPTTLAGVQMKARWLLTQPGADEEALAFVRQLAGDPAPPAEAPAALVAA